MLVKGATGYSYLYTPMNYVSNRGSSHLDAALFIDYLCHEGSLPIEEMYHEYLSEEL